MAEGTSSSHVQEEDTFCFHMQEGADPFINFIMDSIKPMFDKVPPLSSGYCIYRVPERLRSVKPEAYTPLIVSIGPFHHGDDRLKTMEHLKTLYLYFLLHRRPEINLYTYLQVLLELETRARNCYVETIPYTTAEFVKMLLLDGCFLVGKYNDPSLRQDNDLLFKNHWVFNAVHRDVLLLENQIPFFVLETLFNVITPAELHQNSDLSDLIKVFLGHHKLLPRVESLEGEQILLSVLKSITSGGFVKATTTQHQITIAQPNPMSLTSGRFRMKTATQNQITNVQPNPTSLTFIPSATELSRVGITCVGSEPSYLFNVRFPGNGVFYIPSLVVDDRTESFLRNLIALEQTHSKATISKNQNRSLSNKIPTISAYVTLMDCLVNTCADVALLRDQRILYNQLGDDEEVAQLFNKLRTGIIMNPDEFCFSEVFESVNAYYHTKWNEWWAVFYREFWSTPWRKTSLLAAIFLLLCTFGQTVCSILQVLPHWSN